MTYESHIPWRISIMPAAGFLFLGAMHWTPAPASHNQGGPDGFGYRFIDSLEPGGPDFSSEWEDISTSGTPIAFSGYSVWPADDEGQAEVEMGFPFTFYGNSYTTTWVNTNGFLKFGSSVVVGNNGDAAYVNSAIPSPQQPNIIAARWGDGLQVTARYATLGAAPDRQFIVYWTNSSNQTFEAKLHESGEIVILLQSGGSSGQSVGIQDATGNTGLLYSYQGSPVALGDNQAVRFFVPPPLTSSATQTGTQPDSSLQNNGAVWPTGWTHNQIAFSATITADDPATQVRLRVRVKPTTCPSWGAPSVTPLDSGLQSQGSISISHDVMDGAYDWQYRAESENGASAPPGLDTWLDAFANPNGPDFQSGPPPQPPPISRGPVDDGINHGGGDCSISAGFSAGGFPGLIAAVVLAAMMAMKWRIDLGRRSS